MLEQITPLIITYNEQPNIARTLSRLDWARRILIVDSYSTDGTLEIVRADPRVHVVQRRYDTFARQCNFGLEQIDSSWVLSLDADYVLSKELVSEIRSIAAAGDTAGYRVSFKYCVAGRPLRASIYPPRTVLYRKEKARYHDEGHGHRVHIDGNVTPLHGVIYHDDRKPLNRWLRQQNDYMVVESRSLAAASSEELKLQDRVRRWVVLAPVLVFFYTLIGKGLILDGWRGWYYVCQRTIAELILSLHLVEVKFQGR